ncbi:hypothetical protein K439DRAFT_1361028, partial [Ramaria rubella]
PGHMNIEGNEVSDEEAKAAARGDSSPDKLLPKCCQGEIPFSRSAEIQKEKTHLHSKHRSIWTKSPRYLWTSEIDPSLPSDKFLKAVDLLSHGNPSLLFQL